MAVVARLVTFVDIDDASDHGPHARTMSVSARHDAVLTDGRHVVLLDDRGWSGQTNVSFFKGEDPSDEERLRILQPGAWAHETVESLEHHARIVVGPDEPPAGCTQAEEEAAHWDALAQILQRQGIAVEGAELKAAPHDVELSDRVLARIGGGRTDTG